MTMSAVSWGLGLVGITPTAKLVAIRIGDISNPEGGGSISVERLAEWCCASSEQVFEALELLGRHYDVMWFQQPDGNIEYVLPFAARPVPQKSQERGMSPATLYIFRGRLGLKIGMTTRALQQRLEQVRAATLDDTISIEWSIEDREALIRRAERLAHGDLIAKLIRNEWFDASLAEAIAAAQVAIQKARGERQ